MIDSANGSESALACRSVAKREMKEELDKEYDKVELVPVVHGAEMSRSDFLAPPPVS